MLLCWGKAVAERTRGNRRGGFFGRSHAPPRRAPCSVSSPQSSAPISRCRPRRPTSSEVQRQAAFGGEADRVSPTPPPSHGRQGWHSMPRAKSWSPQHCRGLRLGKFFTYQLVQLRSLVQVLVILRTQIGDEGRGFSCRNSHCAHTLGTRTRESPPRPRLYPGTAVAASARIASRSSARAPSVARPICSPSPVARLST